MAQLEISLLFVSPQQQPENIRRWNTEYGLGFTEEDFEKLGPPPAAGDSFIQPVLVPYLDDLKTEERTIRGIERTFEMLWQTVAAQQHDEYRSPEVRSDPKHLRYLKGITHPGKCLRWEVIDLAANWDKKDGIEPKDVRSPVTSPHAGILAAAAHFPEWVQAMDGKTVPYVFLAGYKLNVPYYSRWSRVPRLAWDTYNRQMILYTDHAGHCPQNWAVPSLR